MDKPETNGYIFLESVETPLRYKGVSYPFRLTSNGVGSEYVTYLSQPELAEVVSQGLRLLFTEKAK